MTTHMFKFSDTQFVEPHQDWLGRTVVDRYGEPIGQVVDLLVEERSYDEAIEREQSVHAWTVRATYAVVRVGSGLFGRFSRRKVLIPIASLHVDGEQLRSDDDAGYIRLTLAA
ncbi:MAG TPA: PRC-barrel domain-containing protein [Chloroflexota bacterium]|nr:PRC-barrel domain-containing protein [Chloroflexota bacterium]